MKAVISVANEWAAARWAYACAARIQDDKLTIYLQSDLGWDCEKARHQSGLDRDSECNQRKQSPRTWTSYSTMGQVISEMEDF